MNTTEKIGSITQTIIKMLNLTLNPDTPIFIGENNIKHMQTSHPEDYVKYFPYIKTILLFPDYVIPHPKDGSIQYIKELDQHVLVAIRVSHGGIFFARSLYTMSNEKIKRFETKGLFKKYKIKK